MATQRRHNRRTARGRFSGLYRVLAAILIVAAVTVGCVVFFRVRTIRVEGNRRYTQEEIIGVSGVKEGEYLAFLDQTGISRRLRAELPYIERASIRRTLPDTVTILVEESVAAAVVPCGDQLWLVNSTGKLLEQVEEARAADFPAVSGVTVISAVAGIQAIVAEGDAVRWQCALSLLSALESRGQLSRLDSLDCTGAGEFTVRCDGRYTLLLPTTVKYEPTTKENFSHFFALLDEALQDLGEGEQDLIDFTLWESTGQVYARRSKQE